MNDQPSRKNEAVSRSASRAASCGGHSLIELLLVVCLIGAVTSIALPQMLHQRRLSRSMGISREILTQLRLTRQLAMSERQAFTFRYDNNTKQISVIDTNANPGPATLLADGSYPVTGLTKIISAVPLAESMVSAEMDYGIPSGSYTGALGDGIVMTDINLGGGQVNITFQPDGSVVDSSGDPKGHAIFLFNKRAPEATASAISIMGASGRAKIWKYNPGADRYAE